MALHIVSRKQAVIQGLNWYFNGKPCKYGHIAKRYLYGRCLDCNKSRNRKDEGSKKRSRFYASQRRAQQSNATPNWSESKLIRQFYINCPEGYEVDHIVPIKHDLVCGLHVIANLQYLTITENKIKKNKFPC